jgi:hypothetical protein
MSTNMPEITIKYSIIDISEIPEAAPLPRRQKGFWDIWFESIPPGKAAAIPNTEKTKRTIHTMLANYKARMRKAGFTIHYHVRSDKNNVYVVHEKEPLTFPKETPTKDAKP